MMKNKLLTIAAGLSLLIPVLFWLFAKEGPTLLYPFPALMFIPSFLLRRTAVLVPVVLFFVWNPGLFGGEAKIPRRSYILLIAATVLSVLWFAVGWRDGLAVQGAKYNYEISGINALWMVLLWLVFSWSRKEQPSFRTNLVVHWVMFAWLAWYAFPFMGELI
jgi:hypothetical protein